MAGGFVRRRRGRPSTQRGRPAWLTEHAEGTQVQAGHEEETTRNAVKARVRQAAGKAGEQEQRGCDANPFLLCGAAAWDWDLGIGLQRPNAAASSRSRGISGGPLRKHPSHHPHGMPRQREDDQPRFGCGGRRRQSKQATNANATRRRMAWQGCMV
jgi:hypothetical protein